MNNYTILKKIADAINNLTELYGELAEELPKLEILHPGAKKDGEKILALPQSYLARANESLKMGNSVFDPPLLEEFKKMILQLKLKGSLRARKDGLIEFRHVVLGSTYGHTPEELNEKLTRKIEKLFGKADNTAVKEERREGLNKSVLLSTFYAENYLPYKKSVNLSKKTIEGYEYRIKYIAEKNFDRRLNYYTTQNIEAFLIEVPQTRKRQLLRGFLNNMFRRAVACGLMKSNPCVNVEKYKHHTNKGSAFSFVEQKKFFEGLFSSDIPYFQKCYYAVVYLTGTRRCEALDNGNEDIDELEELFKVNGTKTEKSNRLIPLYPLVKKIFDTLQSGDRGKFFNMSPHNADIVFKKIATQQGIKHKLHDLRHTFGTIQICVLGNDAKTVSVIMGHSGVGITLDRYTHPEQLDRATFLRGNLTKEEKQAIYMRKYEEILAIIESFIEGHTQFLPK